MAIPSPVASVGLVVTEYIWPAPPQARRTWVASIRSRSPEGSSATTPVQRPPSRDEIKGEPVLEDGRGAVTHRFDKGPFHLGARRDAACVKHARRGVPAFPRSRQPASWHPVEDGAESDELVHPLGALVDEHANRRLVTKTCSGA